MRFNNLLLIFLLPFLAACVTTGGRVPDNVKASKVNVELGLGYYRQNNMELASQKLNKALRQDPDSAIAHFAFAILQDRLKQTDKAESHYERATQLDSDDSGIANGYGAFLCNNKREAESEKYFLRALDNPLYKTPEIAYTNAATCLLRIDQRESAKEYLHKALAVRSNFPPALIKMAKFVFEDEDYPGAKLYLDRYHLVTEPTAGSLWLAIRTELQLDSNRDVNELSGKLKMSFPNSEEYKSWLKIQ